VLDDFNPRCRRGTRIGKGGFGSVYKEVRPGGELWAVKVLSKRAHRFKRKWEILGDIATSARLMRQGSFPSNEYFVNLFGWNYNNDYILIAMEHIALGDLEENLKSGWSEEEAKIVTQQLLYGLQVMHSHDITHRDLKPKNIFVVTRQPKIHVKIGDFGISKRVPRDSSTKLVTEIHIGGYTAPEMLRGTEYTSAVDLWALGCVIYRMVMGKPLFTNHWDAMQYSDDEIADRLETMAENLSSDGIDFVKRLILQEAQRRLTAKDALKRAWLE